MTFENIKSGILAVLVLSSIFLTWNLWTYQPEYETIENSNYIQEVSIAEKKEIKTVIKPDLVLYHFKDSHFGNINNNNIEKIIREISQWDIYDVKNYSSKVANFHSLVHGDGNIEIVFPEQVPIDLYKNVLNFEDKSLPKFHFDRIVLSMKNIQKDTGTIYFVSYRDKQVFISHVSSAGLHEINRIFYKVAYQHPRYFAYKSKKGQLIFLPEKETVMKIYKYYPDFLDSEKFKEALFNDPSFVQKSFIPEGEEFTDGTSKMNVFYRENLLFYVNPIDESEFASSSSEILQSGIDFINGHGGWTDPYRYVGMDESDQKITFRLYNSDGYPVFNENGMSEIIEVWGRSEIIKYLRPNFSLDLPIRLEMSEVIVPSGKQILDLLKNQKEFKPELLDSLQLGYHMEKDPKEPKLIVLEPAWFYKYNNSWGQIRLSEPREERNGLE